MEHPCRFEHPYRLEECPPDLLTFWLLDVKLGDALSFTDFDVVSDAAVVARERAAIPLPSTSSA